MPLEPDDTLSYDDWMGTDLPGRRCGPRPVEGPHQGTPGEPIDRPSPTAIPTGEAVPAAARSRETAVSSAA